MHSLLMKLPAISYKQGIGASVLLVLSAILALVFTPSFKNISDPPILDHVIPMQFSGWRNQPNVFEQVSTNPYTESISNALYDQVLMRNYVDQSNHMVMLAIAYAREQRQEIKIHRPEVCYPAQGYALASIKNHIFKFPGYSIPVNGKQVIFRKDNRIEAVSYWIRIGDSFPEAGLEMRLKILKDGLKGYLDDGVLVRVSTIINQESEAQAAYQLQEKFLTDLINGVGISAPTLLIPTTKNPL